MGGGGYSSHLACPGAEIPSADAELTEEYEERGREEAEKNIVMKGCDQSAIDNTANVEVEIALFLSGWVGTGKRCGAV